MCRLSIKQNNEKMNTNVNEQNANEHLAIQWVMDESGSCDDGCYYNLCICSTCLYRMFN